MTISSSLLCGVGAGVSAVLTSFAVWHPWWRIPVRVEHRVIVYAALGIARYAGNARNLDVMRAAPCAG